MKPLMTGLTLALLYVAYCLHERGDWLYAGACVFAAGVCYGVLKEER